MRDREHLRLGRRLLRGFRRIGIVAAAPCFTAAVGMAGYGVVADYQSAHRDDWWKNSPLAEPSAKSGVLTFDDLIPAKPDEPVKPANGPWDAYRTPEPRPDSVDHAELWSSLAWAGGLAATGVLLFLTFSAIGWICAGFVRDQS